MEQVTSYLAARPLRAAVLVAMFNDVRWQASMLNALRAQGRFWGGSGSIILPCTPKFADEPIFWALMEVQDSDTRSETSPPQAMSHPDVLTPRLHGRPPVPADASRYARLFGDAEVAATLWPPPLGGPRTPEQAADLLERDVAHWGRFGFGPWVFFERGTVRFVGRGGLERTTVGGEPRVEVLYAVRPQLWGRGYATEMASASMARARQVRLSEVIGLKAGLRFERTLEHAGRPHWFGRTAWVEPGRADRDPTVRAP